jgi:hypothetical protein
MIDQSKRETGVRRATTSGSTPQLPVFERGNSHPDLLMSDPWLSADVAQANAEEMDRVYAMGPGDDPQSRPDDSGRGRRKLGVGQRAISRLENRDDMLPSTL